MTANSGKPIKLQFGQSPAGKRNPLPPAKRVVGRFPVAGALIAAIFQVAAIENLVRGPGGIALPQRGHPLDVAGPQIASDTSGASDPRPVRSRSRRRRPAARCCKLSGSGSAGVRRWINSVSLMRIDVGRVGGRKIGSGRVGAAGVALPGGPRPSIVPGRGLAGLGPTGRPNRPSEESSAWRQRPALGDRRDVDADVQPVLAAADENALGSGRRRCNRVPKPA